MSLVITIDGPAGAGKSTVARRLAAALRYRYIDTGAMYRALAWKVLDLGISPDDHAAVAAAARAAEIEMVPGPETPRVRLDGQDISEHLRRPEVNAIVSKVAEISEVRRILLHRQRRFARSGGVVLEGRDTGSHVAPDADKKFFLTADFQERVRRRHAELRAEGFDLTREAVAEDLRRRDRLDSAREVAPLRIPEGAFVIDTTGVSIEEAVQRILQHCQSSRACPE